MCHIIPVGSNNDTKRIKVSKDYPTKSNVFSDAVHEPSEISEIEIDDIPCVES